MIAVYDASFKRQISVTVPAETVEQFDDTLSRAETRSGVISQLMQQEIQRRKLLGDRDD